MRILLIHNFYRFRGGEEIYFESLAKLLKSKGHKVLTWTKDNKDIDNSLSGKIRIAKGMFWNKDTDKGLSQVIKRFKPDIAHFNNIFPLIAPTAYRVCKRYGVPVVQSIHNYRFMFPKSVIFRRGQVCELCLNKRFFYPAFFHKCYNQSLPYTLIFSSSHLFHTLIKSFNFIDVFIFPSKFTRSYYLDNANLSHKKFRTIPNFVDIRPRRLDFYKKKDYFLFVGGFTEQKGVLQLLDVFSSLPKLKLVVIGDGPLREEVFKYKKYKNIQIKRFLPRSEVFEFMRNALFTIIPSRWYEVLPTVLIESFANGTPVIVPKLGAFKELVKEGGNGVFYRPNDGRDLVRKLKKIHVKRSQVERMSIFAKEEYKKYMPDIYYKNLLRVYTQLVGKSNRDIPLCQKSYY